MAESASSAWCTCKVNNIEYGEAAFVTWCPCKVNNIAYEEVAFVKGTCIDPANNRAKMRKHCSRSKA